MKVKVKVQGELLAFAPGRCQEHRLEVEEGTTAGDILGSLGIPPEEVWLLSVSNCQVPSDYEMSEGEELSIFPPVTGG